MSARGFTLIELIVCVAIFAMMTALLIAKYGTFNQSVLLTDLAYDTAITIRTAQTYGLSVQSSQVGSNPFNYAYGVDFCAKATGCPAVSSTNTKIILFADSYGTLPSNYSPDGIYETQDSLVSTYNITRGAVVSAICVSNGSDCTSGKPQSPQRLDISFQRPNPDAVICSNFLSPACGYTYAQISIQGTDGSIRKVIVRSTGQVSVQQ